MLPDSSSQQQQPVGPQQAPAPGSAPLQGPYGLRNNPQLGQQGMTRGYPSMPYMLCYPYSHVPSVSYGLAAHSYPPLAHVAMPPYYQVAHDQALSYFQGSMPTTSAHSRPSVSPDPTHRPDTVNTTPTGPRAGQNGPLGAPQNSQFIPKNQEQGPEVRTSSIKNHAAPPDDNQRQTGQVRPSIRFSRNQALGQNGHKPSLFHNFQKHLITLLKSRVRVTRQAGSNRRESKLVSDLWGYFCDTSRVTKRFLKCLLGHIERGEAHLSSKYYQDYGQILRSFQTYSEDEIARAQVCLCQQIVRQGRRMLDNDEFKEARMHKREEFKAYFQQFIEEVETGHISKRLPKRNKQEVLMKANGSESAGEEEEQGEEAKKEGEEQ